MVLEFIAARDYKLMRRVHRWPAPRWIRVWMICATRGGDGWLWYAMGAIILLFGGHSRFAAVGAAGLAAGLGGGGLTAAAAAEGGDAGLPGGWGVFASLMYRQSLSKGHSGTVLRSF